MTTCGIPAAHTSPSPEAVPPPPFPAAMRSRSLPAPMKLLHGFCRLRGQSPCCAMSSRRAFGLSRRSFGLSHRSCRRLRHRPEVGNVVFAEESPSSSFVDLARFSALAAILHGFSRLGMVCHARSTALGRSCSVLPVGVWKGLQDRRGPEKSCKIHGRRAVGGGPAAAESLPTESLPTELLSTELLSTELLSTELSAIEPLSVEALRPRRRRPSEGCPSRSEVAAQKAPMRFRSLPVSVRSWSRAPAVCRPSLRSAVRPVSPFSVVRLTSPSLAVRPVSLFPAVRPVSPSSVVRPVSPASVVRSASPSLAESRRASIGAVIVSALRVPLLSCASFVFWLGWVSRSGRVV
jgi:hypothetical protein